MSTESHISYSARLTSGLVALSLEKKEGEVILTTRCNLCERDTRTELKFSADVGELRKFLKAALEIVGEQ